MEKELNTTGFEPLSLPPPQTVLLAQGLPGHSHRSCKCGYSYSSRAPFEVQGHHCLSVSHSQTSETKSRILLTMSLPIIPGKDVMAEPKREDEGLPQHL